MWTHIIYILAESSYICQSLYENISTKVILVINMLGQCMFPDRASYNYESNDYSQLMECIYMHCKKQSND